MRYVITTGISTYTYSLHNGNGLTTYRNDFKDAYLPTSVGIGTTTPDQVLSVNGNSSKSGGGSWATFSDNRLKRTSVNIKKGWMKFFKLNRLFSSTMLNRAIQTPTRIMWGLLRNT